MLFHACSSSVFYITLLESLLPLNTHAYYIHQSFLYTPEASLTYIPFFRNRGIYSESHPLIPADLMTGPPTHGNLADQPPDIESTEKNVRRFLAVVQEIEPVLNGLALVRTLWRVECLCSTKGCEGSGRLRAGQLVQIRHHVSGRFQGRTFIECAAEECSRATSLAGSRAPSSPPSRDSEGVKVP